MLFTDFPKQVKVHNCDYKVHQVETVDNKKKLDGCIWYDDKIEIKKEMSLADRESTLIHEIIHAVSRAYKIRLAESTVLKLEQGLFETFKSNGWKITKL